MDPIEVSEHESLDSVSDPSHLFCGLTPEFLAMRASCGLRPTKMHKCFRLRMGLKHG